MKRLLLAAALVVVLGGLVLAALLVEYDAPRIGRAVLDHLSNDEVTVTAESFRLSPLRGVFLGDATVDADLPGGRLHATAEDLVLRHRFWPLLSGRLVADELEVVAPRVEIGSGPPPAAAVETPPSPGEGPAPSPGDAGAPPGADAPKPRIRIERLTVEDATVLFGADGEEPTEIRGAELELAGLATQAPGAPLLGLSGEGSLEAESYRDGAVEGRDLSGALTLGDGRLTFTELALDADEGHFRLPTLVFDFGADPYVYRLELVSDPLRTDAMLGTTSGDFGSGTLRFAGAGRGGGPEAGIRGVGELRLEGGALPANPTLAALARTGIARFAPGWIVPIREPRIARHQLVLVEQRNCLGHTLCLRLLASSMVAAQVIRTAKLRDPYLWDTPCLGIACVQV